MKVEIDLNEILEDTYGQSETLADSIRRQIIDTILIDIKKDVTARIQEETHKLIQEELQAQLKECMPTIIEEALTTTYTPIGQYGQPGQPTTFKNELIKTLTSNLVYKKTDYSSNANIFTQTVDSIINENMTKFKKEFDAIVKDNFTKDALAYAVSEMKKRLGLV